MRDHSPPPREAPRSDASLPRSSAHCVGNRTAREVVAVEVSLINTFVADAAEELDRITVSLLPGLAAITDSRDGELLRAQAPLGSGRSAPDSAATPAASRKTGKRAARQWLRDQGIEVGEKGRVPKQYNGMYRSAHPEADL